MKAPAGSSPHTRGTREWQITEFDSGGIIPAYAGNTCAPSPAPLPPRDHPRIRGEHGGLDGQGRFAEGSSPHTRGTQVPEHTSVEAYGIIPAYAGNTRDRWCTATRCRDHPRIRGEHYPAVFDEYVDMGSSPHTRGTRGSWSNTQPTWGIIPAYAGNTDPRCARSRWRWDHPRIRGEHKYVPGAGEMHLGSSPHTRGTRLPARSAENEAWDHPRIRGEHALTSFENAKVGGSSPHTRGTRTHSESAPCSRGIIPAYAGNTVRSDLQRIHSEDHPRIRGEHFGMLILIPPKAGSSPHTRGTLIPTVAVAPHAGIIPAYAGNTPTCCEGSCCWRDHPRIRGEHHGAPTSPGRHTGSSPHTRGTHRQGLP